MTMGPEENATRRLNLAQRLTPSARCWYVRRHELYPGPPEPDEYAERALLSDSEFEAMKQSDLSILISPYLAIASWYC